MRKAKVTEAEVVDVVLGGEVEKRVQDRVHQAARTDLKTASLFAQWTDVSTAIRHEVEEQRQTAQRISSRVMTQIRELKTAPDRDDFVLADEVIDVLNDGWRGRWNIRKFRGVPALAAGAAVLLAAAGLAYLVWNYQYTHTLVAEFVEGDATIVESAGEAVRMPLETKIRYSIPMRLQLAQNAAASLRLPDDTVVRLSALADLLVIDSRRIRQFTGTAAYQVSHSGRGSERFSVLVPQGSIVDLGTEFEVIVADDERAVIRVNSGRVQVNPRNGTTRTASAQQQVILTSQTAVTENFERPQPSSTLDAEPAIAASTPGQVEVALQPRRSVLQADSPLATFVRPLAVRMSVLTPENGIGVKLPPFTASAPRVGSIQTRLNEQPAEIAVASDTKLNGDTWIYLDANRNSDLTDDPHFQEGADFVAGESFTAGLDDRRDALWLQRPIRVDLDSSPPKAVVIEDRIDCINRIYLDSEFDIPGAVPAGSAPRPRFLLLDTNSDGDYGDPDGALGVWVFEPEPGAAMQVLNVAPPGQKTSFLGYRWTLSRNLSGDFVMSGQKIQSTLRDPLRVGDTLPHIEATLTNGERTVVGPPAKGFLLVYAWSTWYSACQRDVPFDFNDLYPKFGPRGLAMLGISTDYRKDDLVSYLERNQITYPQIYNGPDLSEGVLAELGVNQSPIAILVDATGTVVSIGNGASEIWSFLDNNLPK